MRDEVVQLNHASDVEQSSDSTQRGSHDRNPIFPGTAQNHSMQKQEQDERDNSGTLNLQDLSLVEVLELKQLIDTIYGNGVFEEAAGREISSLFTNLLKENAALRGKK